MTRPLISDAMAAAPSLLQPQEYPENVRVEFRSEGAESEEIFSLPSEAAEVSEQPSEEILGEVLWWKEHVVVLQIAGRGSEQEEL